MQRGELLLGSDLSIKSLAWLAALWELVQTLLAGGNEAGMALTSISTVTTLFG